MQQQQQQQQQVPGQYTKRMRTPVHFCVQTDLASSQLSVLEPVWILQQRFNTYASHLSRLPGETRQSGVLDLRAGLLQLQQPARFGSRNQALLCSCNRLPHLPLLRYGEHLPPTVLYAHGTARDTSNLKSPWAECWCESCPNADISVFHLIV